MAKLYAALIAAALIAGAAYWFKSVLDDNATLKANNRIVQGMLDQAEENTKFEHNRAEVALARVAALDIAKGGVDKGGTNWKVAYEALLASNQTARAWSTALVPDPVVDNLLLRDSQRGGAQQVRSSQVADKLQPVVPAAGKPSAPGNGQRSAGDGTR